MTPQAIITVARQRYNAVNDTFWPDQELYDIIYQGSLEMANEGLVIERTFTTTSVNGQQEYAYPTNAIAIKRVTYNGKKLHPDSFREDDTVTVVNQITLATGTPQYYQMWNSIMYLRAVPDTDGLTIKMWAYVEPQAVTSSSTLELPVQYHMMLVNLILSEMSAKNKNYSGAEYYRKLWDNDVLRAKRLAHKKTIADGFNFVKNVDILPNSIIGTV